MHDNAQAHETPLSAVTHSGVDASRRIRRERRDLERRRRGLSIAASRLERRRRDLGIGASRTEREQRGVRGRVSATRLARRQRQRRDRPGAGEGESSRTDRLRRRARDRENLSARV